MYKANIYNLVLEVTRKCNLCCEHCLRGDAEQMDMSNGLVDQLLDNVSSIGSVTFSGGEPTLNIPLIRHFFEEVRRRKIELGSFFVVTNGITNQMDLALLLLENIPYCYEKEMCGVACSVDNFHDNDEEQRESPVRYLSFYSDSKETGDFYKGAGIIQRGRADSPDFDGGRREDPTIDFEVEGTSEDGEDICVDIDGEFYVSSKGQICADCDLSYPMMEDYSVGTVAGMQTLLRDLAEEFEED